MSGKKKDKRKFPKIVSSKKWKNIWCIKVEAKKKGFDAIWVHTYYGPDEKETHRIAKIRFPGIKLPKK